MRTYLVKTDVYYWVTAEDTDEALCRVLDYMRMTLGVWEADMCIEGADAKVLSDEELSSIKFFTEDSRSEDAPWVPMSEAVYNPEYFGPDGYFIACSEW